MVTSDGVSHAGTVQASTLFEATAAAGAQMRHGAGPARCRPTPPRGSAGPAGDSRGAGDGAGAVGGRPERQPEVRAAKTAVPRVEGDVNTEWVLDGAQVDDCGRPVSKLTNSAMPARIAYLVLSFVSAPRRRMVVGLSLCFALSACSLGDPRVPWDTSQMGREIADDLRRFEHVDAEFRQVEVLGWRTIESQQKRPAPLDAIRHRSSEALVWVRVESGSGVPGWIVVDAWRGPDSPWRRVIIDTEYIAPAPPPRPGEDTSGTWHGFNRYTTPPTSEQVCEFARVAFLNPRYLGPDSRVVITELRRSAWRRLTGTEPACSVNE